MQSRATKILRKLPEPAAKVAKLMGIYPHYWFQAAKCRLGYMRYGDRYTHNILFVAGMPKSGTTWLENMLGCFPGYGPLLIPESQFPERIKGEEFDLPEDTFSRMKNMLVVSKMHLAWTPTNGRLLNEYKIPYVVQYRDFRDMYVSNYFYIRMTPWHFRHGDVVRMDISEFLDMCIEGHLPDYVKVVDAWRDNRNPEHSMMLRYEDLIADTFGCMQQVRSLFDLPATDEELAKIVEDNSFASLSKGRKQGQENAQSHFRKGVAGDWKNHFTDKHKDAIKAVAGDWLIKHGYEENLDW